MAEILDSGERREFESGAVRDVAEGKGRCDLLPLTEVSNCMMLVFKDDTPLSLIAQIMSLPRDKELEENLSYAAIHAFCREVGWDICTAILETSIHFEDGCKKYGERNWQKGIPAHCYIDSAVRHYLKHSRGDTDERHDRAFVWNMLCFAWTIRNRPECYDLPSGD